jgi:hypothetical protein
VRAIVRIVTGVGCVTAALLLAGQARAQVSGGTGTFSGGSSGGGSSGGGGGGGGSGGSGAQNVGGQMETQTLQQGIVADSLLGSFNNVGSGSTSRSGSSNSAVSSSNPLSAYYYNPLAQGLVSSNSSGTSSSNAAAFGTPLFSNLSSSSSSSSLGGRNTGSAFGGSSTTGSSFGGIGSSTSRGSTGLSGTATIRGGTGTIAPGFTGSSWGPAIGRRGPVTGATLRVPARAIPILSRRGDLQQIIAGSTRLSAPGNITILTDGNTIVLSGTVANEDDRRMAENMLRLAPGVQTLRNDLTVGPGPISPPPGAIIPGPGPISPPPGTGP